MSVVGGRWSVGFVLDMSVEPRLAQRYSKSYLLRSSMGAMMSWHNVPDR